MQRFFIGLSGVAVFFLLLFFSACTKIDSTTLGNDLIPAVDNVHTFADTLVVNGTQGFFNDDSTRVSYTDYHPLGSITNDPLFGKTTADLYLQLKPNFYPFYFGTPLDTINDVISPAIGANGTSFDSAVLCLSYKSFYGDTTIPQSLSVYQLDDNVSLTDFKDSAYRINFLPNQTAGETFLGSATIDPRTLSNYTYFKGSVKDSINNQVRIKLSDAFLESLIGRINRDTTTGLNGMYYSDSLFKAKIKGFHIKADGVGNGLFYIAVNEAATRLEIHFKKIRNNVIDTSYSSFSFSTGVSGSVSAQATHLERDRSGSESVAGTPGALYLQTTPGTYASLSIPALANFQNSIIHRAELMIEQIPTNNPQVEPYMLPPAYLYLDIKNDTGTVAGSGYKPVYYDLNANTTYNPDNLLSVYNLFLGSGIDYPYYGGYLRIKEAGTANQRYFYTFNIARHVQHIVTNGVRNYDFRLFAPFKIDYYGLSFPYRNLLANGRVKIGNGDNTEGYKMYLRIVYSKL